MQNQNKFHYKAMMFLSFAGPAVILFSAVVIVPFLFGLYLTFTGWDGISSGIPFVGLENYVALFQDGCAQKRADGLAGGTPARQSVAS